MNLGQTRLLQQNDALALQALRVDAYKRIRGFTVKESALAWSKADEQSFILGVWSPDDELVASIRIEVITDRALACKKLEVPGDKFSAAMPIVILSRASTRKDWEGRGLNCLLRLYAIELAKSWNIRFVMGTLAAGSSRERSMRQMGYRICENTSGWSSPNFKSHDQVLLAELDLSKNYQKAVTVCRRIAGAVLEQFPFCEGSPALRFVEVI